MSPSTGRLLSAPEEGKLYAETEVARKHLQISTLENTSLECFPDTHVMSCESSS